MEYQELMDCVLSNCGLYIVGIDKIKRRMISNPEYRNYLKTKDTSTDSTNYVKLHWRDFLVTEDIEQIERIIKFHILYWINNGVNIYQNIEEYIEFIKRMWSQDA